MLQFYLPDSAGHLKDFLSGSDHSVVEAVALVVGAVVAAVVSATH